MKKKILALITALILVVSAVPFTVSANDFIITFDAVQVEDDGTAVVNVKLENNPGLWGVNLNVSYDKDNLTFKSLAAGNIFSSSELMPVDPASVNGNFTIQYMAAGFTDYTSDGILATITFEVNDTTVASDYDISASYNYGDIISVTAATHSPAIVNGRVSVPDARLGYKGASIRTEGTQALRFMFTVDKGYYETLTKPQSKNDTGDGFGAVVYIANYLGNEKLVKGVENEQFKSLIVPAVNIYDEDENYVYFTACITDIPATATALNEIYYVAVPYATVDGTTVYGTQTEATSVYAIAKACVADDSTTPEVKEYLQTNVLDIVTGA